MLETEEIYEDLSRENYGKKTAIESHYKSSKS